MLHFTSTVNPFGKREIIHTIHIIYHISCYVNFQETTSNKIIKFRIQNIIKGEPLILHMESLK